MKDLDELNALNNRAVELREELHTINEQIYDRVKQLTAMDKKQRVEELSVPGSKTWDEREDTIVKDVLSE